MATAHMVLHTAGVRLMLLWNWW